MVRRVSALLALAILGLGTMSVQAQERQVLVFAAASLKNALDAAVAAFQTETGASVAISYAGSSALAKQIEQGAPAEMFISANLEWMDHLEERGLIDAASRVDLLGNRLVLVAPADGEVALEIGPDLDLAAALGEDGRLALANVDAVPAGVYAKAALTNLGLWNSVEARTAQAADVRAALALVSRGEAPLGIVYATDAVADTGVKVVAEFSQETHDPIVYPVALIEPADDPDAAALLEFLTSEAARRFFEDQGFTLID